MDVSDAQAPVRLTATVQGYVQGVGFRWSTMALAQSLKLVGVAENPAAVGGQPRTVAVQQADRARWVARVGDVEQRPIAGYRQ